MYWVALSPGPLVLFVYNIKSWEIKRGPKDDRGCGLRVNEPICTPLAKPLVAPNNEEKRACHMIERIRETEFQATMQSYMPHHTAVWILLPAEKY